MAAKKKITKDKVLIMRFPEAVKAALKKAADADQRSMSALALKVISDHLKAQGFLAPESKSPKSGGRS